MKERCVSSNLYQLLNIEILCRQSLFKDLYHLVTSTCLPLKSDRLYKTR